MMQWLTEKYNFNKFWKYLSKKSFFECKQHNGHTNGSVFIKRTLDKWFADKFYQVEIYKFDNTNNQYYSETKYIQIHCIRFLLGGFHTSIIVNYKEPHSKQVNQQEIYLTDFFFIKIKENETDFKHLQSFYTINKISKENFSPITFINNQHETNS